MRLTTLLILLSSPAFCQITSQEGRFAVDFQIGCTPFTVNITSLDDFGDISRQYIYENGVLETDETSYTYTLPGTYSIVQIVGVDVDPKTDTLVVTVLDPFLPEFNIFKCDANSVLVEISDSYYDEFLVSTSDGQNIMLGQSDRSTQFTFSEIGPQQVFVEGFFTNGQQNCGQSTKDIIIAPFVNESEILQVELSRSCLNELNATVHIRTDSLQLYEVQFADNDGNYQTLTAGPIISDSLIFNKFSMSTSQQICFRINVISSCTSTKIEGVEFCVENINESNPEITNAFATYTDQGILFSFDNVGTGSFGGEKKVLGFDFEVLDTLFSGYLDQNISPIRKYEYKIDFADTCGNNISDIDIFPSFVSIEETNINEYEVHWEPPLTTLAGDLSFTMNIVGVNTEELVSINEPESPQTIFLSQEQGKIQLVSLSTTVTTLDTPIISNAVPMLYEYRAYIPDAFTPNGDGLNDNLRVLGVPDEGFDIKIYNRWGEIIFRSNETAPGWDGLVREEEAPDGKYYYTLTFLTNENERIQQQGSFVILRN